MSERTWDSRPLEFDEIVEHADGVRRAVAGNLQGRMHTSGISFDDLSKAFKYIQGTKFFRDEIARLSPDVPESHIWAELLYHEGDVPGIVLGLGELMAREGVIDIVPSTAEALRG